MDPTKLEELAQGIIGTVRDGLRGAGKDFLDKHADAKTLIEARARRVAELVLEYAEAKDEARPEIAAYMRVVKQTIENEALSVALDAEAAAKGTFLSVLASVFQFALQNLPAILAMIK